jgi:hypothetical protein
MNQRFWSPVVRLMARVGVTRVVCAADATRWPISATLVAVIVLVVTSDTYSQRQPRKIMIFGGRDHRTYLGCLSCPRTAPDSIFNSYGEYGHCRLFSDNLFCRTPFSDFGSRGPLQDLSACSSNASNPPVIVDEDGGYYGRFCIGGTFAHDDAVCSRSIFGKFKNKAACEIVEWTCEQ